MTVSQPAAPPKRSPGLWASLPDWVATLLSNPRAMAGLLILLALVLVAVFAPQIAPYQPDRIVARRDLPPSSEHVLGTTSLGQDVFLADGLRDAHFAGGRVCHRHAGGLDRDDYRHHQRSGWRAGRQRRLDDRQRGAGHPAASAHHRDREPGAQHRPDHDHPGVGGDRLGVRRACSKGAGAGASQQ
ncbi:MAG: hypothetical protein HND48_02440 [Chloroflexi bacterium]|nr:hypothetical protein [Chloroflexota bacterium]